MKTHSQIKEKSEPAALFYRNQMENMLSDPSPSIPQNMNHNFTMEQAQLNDGQLSRVCDTPTTPMGSYIGRSQPVQRSLNTGGISNMVMSSKDYYQPHFFSPNPKYTLFSPDYNPCRGNAIMDEIINPSGLYTNNMLQFSEMEEFPQKTPLPSTHVYHHNFIQSNYSYKNTPLGSSLSPHLQIYQSGGRIQSSHNHDQLYTPIQFAIQNNNPISATATNNNIFNQLNQTTPFNQSPFNSLVHPKSDIFQYDHYNALYHDNDPFDQDQNNLADWVEKENLKEEHKKEEEQEEDDDDYDQNAPQQQQFGNRLRKKLKTEDKEITNCIQEEHNENTSFTEVPSEMINGGDADKKEKNKGQKQVIGSSVKTVKHNYNISPENQKYQITPLKNNFDPYSFMTPNNQQDMSTHIESNLTSLIPKQKQLTQNTPSQNTNNFRNQDYEMPSSQRNRSNNQSQGGNGTQYSNNRNNNTQKDGNASDEEAGGNRNERGLRILSKEVLDIVREKNETTYKEVTEEIIQNRQKSNQSMGQDEQNIKRRVYDALNVLIAADLIVKTEKKKIKYKKSLNEQPKSSSNNKHAMPKSGFKEVSNNQLEKQQNQITYFKNSLDSKKDRLKRKNEVLKDLVLKMVASSHLIERNEQNELKNQDKNSSANAITTQSSSNESTHSLKCISLSKGISPNGEDSMKFRFPFIACQSPSDNSKMSFKKFTSGLVICSMRQLKLKGDIDLLVQLYTMNNLSSIEEDIQQYINPSLSQFMQRVQSQLYEEEVKLEQEFTVSNNKHIQHIVQNHNLSIGNINDEPEQEVQNSEVQSMKKQRLKKEQHHNYEEDDSSQITTNQSNNARNDNNNHHHIENQNTSGLYQQVPQTPDCNQNCDEYENYIN